MTERYNQIAPDWPHHKRLKALAIMFGYGSWEDLVASCRPDAPGIIFDQDLDRASREARWLSMAEAVSDEFGVELPYALDLVRFIAPTCDRGRDRSSWYEPNDTFNAALSRKTGLWWCCIGEHGHPFVPPGFVLQQACHYSELCFDRLRDPYALNRSSRRDVWVLVPSVGIDTGGIRSLHTYFRQGQLLEIDPIPMADYLRAPSKHAARLKEFFTIAYPQIKPAQQQILMVEWRHALQALHMAAGLSARSTRRWVQVTVSARQEADRAWYWPLRPRPFGESLEKASRYAHEVDGEILKHFGRDPGYVDIS